MSGIVHSPVRNAVVLTGDVHSHWAAEVRERFDDPSLPVVATELVTTSISSGGDGSDSRDDIAVMLAENPHIRYYTNRRGYIRTRITRDELRVDFRVVPFVSRPGADVRTRRPSRCPIERPRCTRCKNSARLCVAARSVRQRAPHDQGIGLADHLVILAVVVELAEYVAHGVDPGALLVVAFDNDPRREIGVGCFEHLFLGRGVGVPFVQGGP